MKDETLDGIYWPLRLTYGLVPLLAGLDKYFGFLADWERYLSPTAASLLPVAPSVFFQIVGVVEIAVGFAVLAGATRLGALVASGWLVVIALDLVLGGFFDVAVRDLAMAVGAYSLFAVAGLRGEALVPQLASSSAASAPRIEVAGRLERIGGGHDPEPSRAPARHQPLDDVPDREPEQRRADGR